MASVESAVNPPNDRQSRLRPFAWMKRLTNLKNSSNGHSSPSRKSSPGKAKKSAKRDISSQADPARNKTSSPKKGFKPVPGVEEPAKSEHNFENGPGDEDEEPEHERENQFPGASNRSTAPTLDTNPGTLNSEAGHSKAETSGTTVGGMSAQSEGINSIFSSSNPSSHSLTTTLTTIQSTAPSGVLHQVGGAANGAAGQHGLHQSQTSHHQHNGSQSSTYFSHQYPTTPASAVPSHLTPGSAHVPMTYRSAIANNLYTDNASILTLASSSNRRHNRRNSVDTDASVRAIAPASMWGGSRESLPLSILSKEADSLATGGAVTPVGGASQSRPSISGISEQRVNVYSSGGINAPALNSERNSVYTGRGATVSGVNSPATPINTNMTGANNAGSKEQSIGPSDGVSVASIKSGVLGHVRQDSIGSPLVTSTTADRNDDDTNSDDHSVNDTMDKDLPKNGSTTSTES